MTMIKKPKKEKFNLHPLRAFIVAIALIIWAFYELATQGETLWYWFFLVVGGIIILPNVFWLASKLGTPFGVPYFFTMLKTKKFVNTIIGLGSGKTAKILEKVSIGGLFLGFGLAGIDYWTAREKGGIKRILILIIGAIGLGLIFWYLLGILFATPALSPLFWFSLIAFVLLGFGGLTIAILLGYGVLAVMALFTAEQICPSVFPVLPGVPIPGIGVLIPLIGWVSLGAIMVIHELSHGVMLAKYKEKLKSVGLILVGIVPMGAFVEQKDESFMKKPERKQILVLSAGPSSNLFTMVIGIVLLILLYASIPLISGPIDMENMKAIDGLEIAAVGESINLCGIDYNSPAYGKLFEGDRLISLNGVSAEEIVESGIKLENRVVFNYESFMNRAQNSGEISFKPAEFVVDRNGEDFNIIIQPVLIEQFNVGYSGVDGLRKISSGYVVPLWVEIESTIILNLDKIIFFFIILSFAVGMFNFMPSDPLDGGRIAKFVLLPYVGFMGFNKEDGQKFIGRLFAWLFLISILLNLLPYVTMFF